MSKNEYFMRHFVFYSYMKILYENELQKVSNFYI